MAEHRCVSDGYTIDGHPHCATCGTRIDNSAPATRVHQEDDEVVIMGPDNTDSRRKVAIGPLTIEETKYLQQQLQSVTGVPGDLPAPAKQERNTAGVTGARGKK